MTANQILLQVLKEDYLRKLKKEKWPDTPKLSETLDVLEESITELQDFINEHETERPKRRSRSTQVSARTDPAESDGGDGVGA